MDTVHGGSGVTKAGKATVQPGRWASAAGALEWPLVTSPSSAASDGLLITKVASLGMPKDTYMVAYLEEVHKLEKHFKGMELKHIPRGENQEVDELARRAARREAQMPGVFEERLVKASVKQIGRASCRERVYVLV